MLHCRGCNLHSSCFFLGFNELLGIFEARQRGDGVDLPLVVGEECGGECAMMEGLVEHSCGLFLLGMHLI